MNLLAAVGWGIVLVVPGSALMRLTVRELGWAVTVMTAPAVSFGFIYAVGLLASRLSLPPAMTVILAAGTMAVLAAGVELRRVGVLRRPVPSSSRWQRDSVAAGRSSRAGARPIDPAMTSAGLLLAGAMVLGLLLWYRFQSTMVVPVGWDAMHHGYFIRQIAHFGTMDASVVLASDPSGTDGSGIYYPLAFDLSAAALHVGSGVPISTLMLGSAPIVAGTLLPAGTFALARQLDPSRPLVAGFAAVASVLPLNLFVIEGTGRLTGILGLAVVPGTVALMTSRSTTNGWGRAAILGLALIGVIGLHTSEFPTVMLAAGVITVVWAVQHRAWGPLVRWSAWTVATVAGAMVIVALLEPNAVHLATERSASLVANDIRPAPTALYTAVSAGTNAWGLAVLGVALTLRPRWRRFLGAASVYVLVGILFYLVVIGWKPAWSVLAVPWYRDSGRISWNLTVLSAIPVGVALAALSGSVASLMSAAARGVQRRTGAGRSYRGDRWIATAIAGAAGLVIVAIAALPPVGPTGAAVNQVAGPVDSRSEAAFRYLAQHVQPGSRVFDDLRLDGAMWMYVDYGVHPLFGNSPLLGAAPDSWKERLWLSYHLAKIDSDPCVLRTIEKYSISYVYYGERQIFDGPRHISLHTLRQSPHLTEVFVDGQAHVFRLEPAEAPAVCGRDLTAGVRW